MPTSTTPKPSEKSNPTVPTRERGELPPVAADQLIRVDRFLQRFDRSQTRVLAVRTYQTASGERYSRTTREPWRGL